MHDTIALRDTLAKFTPTLIHVNTLMFNFYSQGGGVCLRRSEPLYGSFRRETIGLILI